MNFQPDMYPYLMPGDDAYGIGLLDVLGNLDNLNNHWNVFNDSDSGDESEYGSARANHGISQKQVLENKRKAREMKAKNKSLRLSRRLTYLLRYGAEREGLTVHQGGYVGLQQLLALPLLKGTTKDQITSIVSGTLSFRGTPRFESKGSPTENGGIQIRARYGMQMQRYPYHEGTKVTRLLEACATTIVKNIGKFDFVGFPDVYLLNTIIHKLKRAKKLNNTTLRLTVTNMLEYLDLEGMHVKPSTIKVVAFQGPNLRVLNLRGLGYVMTDHLMEVLCRKLKKLQSLNISGCDDLTDRTLNALVASNSGSLMHLNASGNFNFTEKAIINLILTCKALTHLDIFDNRYMSQAGRHTLVDISRERKLTVVLQGLDDKQIAPEDPAMVLTVWRGQLI